jgi:hypothetical protein
MHWQTKGRNWHLQDLIDRSKIGNAFETFTGGGSYEISNNLNTGMQCGKYRIPNSVLY